MPRPRKLDARHRQLNIALKFAEYEVVERHALARGVRPVVYARQLLLGGKAPASPPSRDHGDIRLLYQQWIRVGSNLNQITRALNTLRPVSSGDVDRALTGVRKLIQGSRFHGA